MIYKLLLLGAIFVHSVATRTVSDVTPTVGTLQSIFGPNVLSEIPDDAAASFLILREWARVENTTQKAPFLMCVPSLRENAQSLLDTFPTHIPVIVDATRSCFLVHGTSTNVVEVIAALATDLEIVTPLPSVLKIATGFFDQMNSDAFVGRACQQGLRVTTAPGLDPLIIQDLADSVTTDLSTGSYRIFLPNFFVSSESPRGQRWQERLAIAESDGKNFTVAVTIEEAILTIQNLCFPETSAYIMALVAYLATLPQIIAVEPVPVITLNNFNGVGIVQSGTSTLWPLWSAGLRGNGQVAGVSDTGLDINNCYFRQTAGGGGGINDTSVFGPTTIGAFNQKQRKIVQYLSSTGGDTSDFLNGHGTHVCGTVVGYIAGSAIGAVNTYNGAAPDGKVAFFDLDNGNGLIVPSLNTIYRPQMRAGARVFSQSWGSPTAPYSGRDVSIDTYMYQNPTTVTLFAAGNDGNIGIGTIGMPSGSKNAISVGATMVSTTFPTIQMATFSSVGPTRDGRIKPDVVAPGQGIISAKGQTSCGTVTMSGTSMACPLVAGITLLVRQYFMEGWYPTGVKISANRFTPTGALVKAMLVNSAVRVQRYVNASGAVLMLGPPPDMYQGFGQVQLTRVLKLGVAASQPDLFVVNSRASATAIVHTYKFTVRSSYSPPASTVALLDAFEVTLTWMDPNGLANAVKIVLNDLDLVARLDSAPGTLEYPNNRGNADTLNNVEKIRVQAPLPNDVITVNVTGTTIVATPNQAYALVASGPFVAAAWYCRDSRSNRQDSQWRTEYCPIACTGAFLKSPRCCATLADGSGGNTCDSSLPSACTGITVPVECVL